MGYKEKDGQVDESPDGANMALPYLVAEWSEVCLFEGVKEVFAGSRKSPDGADARGAFD